MMPEEDIKLTPEEEALLKEYFASPAGEEKTGLYHFLNKVLEARNTSKVGNLEDNELEAVRRYQAVDNYAMIMGLPRVADFFKTESEIVLATSDSKRGFLITSAITSKRELKTRRGDSKKKFGWFGKAKEEGEE